MTLREEVCSSGEKQSLLGAGGGWLRSVWAPLWRLSHVTRYELLHGVVIDLRHPLIEPSQWRVETLWTDPGWSPGPSMAFPWHLSYDLSEFDEFEAVVLAGDRIQVSRVERRSVGDAFDHPHDREVREAYLQVVRHDGTIELLDAPIRFEGATRIQTETDWGLATLEKVEGRILDHFRISSLGAIEPNYGEVALPDYASQLARQMRTALAQFSRLLAGNDLASDLVETWVSDLVDHAVALGYAWSRSEAAEYIRPLAESGLASAVGAELAGYRSGEARRRKAQETWHPHALELAIEARRMNPRASQDAVVADIQAGWKHEVPRCPGTKTLKGFVSAKERSGDLPRRQ